MYLASILVLKSILFISRFPVSETDLLQSQQKDGIELVLTNIRNKTGLIRIGVFRADDGYPDKPAYNFSLAKDTTKNGRIRFLIPVDKNGPVSLCILDDENMNGKMDYIFGIMPKEGFGFSNNPRIKGLKEPPFSETSFTYSGGEKVVKVSLVYI